MIEIESFKIKDIKLLKTNYFEDMRGFFRVSFKKDELSYHGIDNNFIQDNHSYSKKGVLRGLHYQSLNPQAKLVQVISGEIFDVAVDLRKKSPTFGNWVARVLSAKNSNVLFIPRGFAHGFLSLKDNTVVYYKCDNFYDASDQKGIRWDDPELNIKWPQVDKLITSEKDKKLPLLKDVLRNL